MDALQFKTRYLAHVRRACVDAPPELLADLSEFVSFDPVVLENNALRSDEISFLTSGGLPHSAAPYLSFQSHSDADLEHLYEIRWCPRTLFPLGSTGEGDPLGIELSSHAVVYLNHDDDMRRVFINSSLSSFAESLVWYQELRHTRQLGRLLEKISVFDPQATVEGSMWHSQAGSVVGANDA
jgi:hypothetical protein